MAGSTVSISELRDWAGQIFDAAERRGQRSIDLSGRYYWMFDKAEIWGAEPPEPVLGDLADDLEDVRRDLGDGFGDEDRAAFVWHTLDHFTGILGKLSADLQGCSFADNNEGRA